MQKIIFAILVRNIDKKIIKNNKFVIVKLYFSNKINRQSIKEIVIAKIYIINNFEANLSVDNNILIFKSISINLKNCKLVIDNCKNLEISIRVKICKNSSVKRVIRACQIYTIMLDKLAKVLII